MALVSIAADRRTRLRVYLNDHLAGATGGVRLAKRCKARNEENALGEFMAAFVGELEQDRAELEELMDRLGFVPALPKQAAAVAVEAIGRLKLNGQVAGYSALSRLEELETLAAGVRAKRSLWTSLLTATDIEPELAGADLEALIVRADEQHAALDDHRLAAAVDALSRP
jgi:hypothetical protein